MENIEPTGIDRRTLIKRAGIVGAGAAVWSAPSVTSLASRAYAAGSVSTACKTCAPYSFPSCNPSKDCGCTGTQSGNGCVCVQNAPCSVLQPCSSQSDCPSGYTCSDANNGCGQQVCVASCDNVTGASVPSDSGPMFASRP